MTESAPLITFRIRAVRGAWRIEYWDDQHSIGYDWAGWSKVYSGAESVEDARAFFTTAAVLEWDDDTHMTGRYSFR